MSNTPSGPHVPPAGLFIAAATIAFAFMRPERARVVAAGILVAGVLLLGGLALWPQPFALGLVTDILPDGTAQLAALAPPLGEAFPVRVEGGIADPLVAGDIAAVLGTRAGDLLTASHVGIAPVSQQGVLSGLATVADVLDGSSAAGILVIAALLAAFAPLVLRLTNAALIAVLAAGLAFAVAQLNAGTQTIALPDGLVDPLFWTAGLAGGAVGFKAAMADRTRAWTRLAGLILAAALVGAVTPVLDVPENLRVPLAMAAGVVALVVPVLPVLAFAALIVGGALGLALPGLAVVFGLVGGLRMAAARLLRRAPQPVRSVAPSFTPDPTGHVSLRGLFPEEH